MNSDEDEYSFMNVELAFLLLKNSILNSLVFLWDYNMCKLCLMLLFIRFLLTLLALGSSVHYFSSVFVTEVLEKLFF